MTEIIRKLSEEEQNRLGILLEEADRLITNSDHLTEEDVGDTYECSALKKGISDVMYELGKWC